MSSLPPSQNPGDESRDEGVKPARRREPSLSPPPFVLSMHGGRVLDTSNAVRIDDEPIRPTAYVSNVLLVRKLDWDRDEALKAAVTAAAETAHVRLEAEDSDPELAAVAARYDLSGLSDELETVRLVLKPVDTTKPSTPPDAWKVLQIYRGSVSREERQRDRVTLDHLMTSGSTVSGAPFMGVPFMGVPFMGVPFMGVPFMGVGTASTEYAMPGHGGRMPVVWLGREPIWTDDDDETTRRPVVAVLDTGAGSHPWLRSPVVVRDATVDGSLLIGMADGKYNAEKHPALASPLEGTLDPDAGHGTFIAGIIRQTCPNAKILAIRVMHGDGTIPESTLLRALRRLVLRQAIAVQNQDSRMLVDVVCLSLGYYHELPSDLAMDHKILAPLRHLGRLGVVVVAAAGNDSTDRHFYPAGFAPHPGSKLGVSHTHLPLVSVGSLNPDARVGSLFSNEGDWVTTRRQGASIVSTFPTDFDGSARATVEFELANRGRRGTIDPDDFRSGFGTWSGTSFAAPVLAGQIADHLYVSGRLNVTGVEAATDRTWQAISDLTGLSRPADDSHA